MMRSLSSAVAGLRTHQTKMDVIGNNIANVNTYGFKASRTTFADVYYQNLSRGSGAGTVQGGTNPTQIGYGSSVATIDVLNTQSGAASTDRAMDVYITGDGYLVTQDPSGKYLYTRLGALYFDASGNLVDSNGNYMMGFPLDADGQPMISADGTISGDAMRPIQVDTELLDQLTGISISADGMISGILPGDKRITVSAAAPAWIDSANATIPEDSNITGNIRLQVRAQFDAAAMQTALTDMGITGTVSALAFSDTLCMSNNLKLTADENGNLFLSGSYINENGKTVNFITTAAKPDANNDIKFMHNGKELVSMNIANYQTSNTIPAGYYTDRANQNCANPLVNAELSKALQKAGIVGASAAAFSPMTGEGPFTDLQITVAANGLITITGNNDGTAFTATGTYNPAAPGTVTFNSTATGNPALFSMNINSGALPQINDPGNPYYMMEIAIQGAYTYNITYKDKGGNTHHEPEDDANGNLVWNPITSVTAFAFGDVYIPITDPGQATAYNGNIGSVSTTDGNTLNIGCLVLAKFRNAAALEQAGSSSFAESANSGAAMYVKPGLEGTGDLKAGYLEMSNVDISKEFTDMITTQRGFQANTRIVTVSDEMLQELVNLKR